MSTQKKKKNTKKGQKPRKRGLGSSLARGALSAASGATNLLLPGAGGVVSKLGQALLDKLGFDERVVLPAEFPVTQTGSQMSGGLTGGKIVGSAAAPVAFSRDQISTSGYEYLHEAHDDDGVPYVIVRIHEPLLQASTPIAPTGTQGFLNEWSPMILPLHQRIAGNFQEYATMQVKIHYTHFAPTIVFGRVFMMWADDAMLTYTVGFGSSPMIFGDAALYEDFACGSVYEDFALVAHPVRMVNWYNCFASIPDPTPGAALGFNFQGAFSVAVDMPTAPYLGTPVGQWFMETTTCFRKTRQPTFTVGLGPFTSQDIDLGMEMNAIGAALHRLKPPGSFMSRLYSRAWVVANAKPGSPGALFSAFLALAAEYGLKPIIPACLAAQASALQSAQHPGNTPPVSTGTISVLGSSLRPLG